MGSSRKRGNKWKGVNGSQGVKGRLGVKASENLPLEPGEEGVGNKGGGENALADAISLLVERRAKAD